ncbi:MAG: sugar nucleotide-binding protein [bacterium]
MKKLQIAITGSTGLIGSRFIELLSNKFDFIPLRQEDGVDITNRESLQSTVVSRQFDFLLHLAAYTNVDGAETNRELCHNINVTGTKNLFDICQKKGAKMVLFSTDFVFDGRPLGRHPDPAVAGEGSHHKFQSAPPWRGGPNSQINSSTQVPTYVESSPCHPLSYYAQTKYESEQVVQDAAMIVRLTTPYRSTFEPKKDIVRTIKSLLEQGKELTMITDNLLVPTYIDDIALATGHLLAHYSPEIFHAVGTTAHSAYDMGQMIAQRWNLDSSLIIPTTHAQYSQGRAAARPQYAHIISTKDLGVKMKGFEEGLRML